MGSSLQVLTVNMTESSEISFAIEPPETRNEVHVSKPGDDTSRKSLSKVIYRTGKSKLPSSFLLREHNSTRTRTQSRRLRRRVKSFTLHSPAREARPRKLSAPELGTSEKHTEDQIHMYANVLDSQQGKRHLITGAHLCYRDRCCYCQYHEERKESPREFEELWLLKRGSHKERRSANSVIFIPEQTKLQYARRGSVMYLGEEPACGKRNTNSKTKRRHSTSSTRSTCKTPGYWRSRQSLQRESQLPDGKTTAVAMNRQMSTTGDMSGGSGAVALSSRWRVSADPESDSACEETSHNAVQVTDKRRRLIVSLFTTFVIMLVAVAIIMIAATLSIGAGGTGSA